MAYLPATIIIIIIYHHHHHHHYQMIFVSTWLSFAVALYLVNRLHGRKTYDTVPYWDRGVIWQWGPLTLNWKAMLLILMGLLGEEEVVTFIIIIIMKDMITSLHFTSPPLMSCSFLFLSGGVGGSGPSLSSPPSSSSTMTSDNT